MKLETILEIEEQFTGIGKLEHIGIAIESKETLDLFNFLLGRESYKSEAVESEGVVTHFYWIGNVKIELLEATTEDSPIAKFTAKRGAGIHHLAFSVRNINEAIDSMKKKGIRVLNETPKKGADNKIICFLHPKDTAGVLIEFCQEQDDKDGQTD